MATTFLGRKTQMGNIPFVKGANAPVFPFKDVVKPTSFGNSRKIIHSDRLTKEQEEGLIRLHDQLAPLATKRPVDCNLIVEEALPIFKEQIEAQSQGQKKFTIFVQYLGIENLFDIKKSTKRMGKKEKRIVDNVISTLRTMENAMHYLYGYKELVERFVSLIFGEEKEAFSTIELFKLARMYFVIFAGQSFFVEDVDDKQGIFDCRKALNNNSIPFGPEEFFIWFHLKIEKYFPDVNEGKEAFLFALQPMIYEYRLLNERNPEAFEEVIKFAELKWDFLDEETLRISSVNSCGGLDYTFEKVRKLKQKVAGEEFAFASPEQFCYLPLMKNYSFDFLYTIYKFTTCFDVSIYTTTEELQAAYIDGKYVQKAYKKINVLEHALENGTCQALISVGGTNEVKRWHNFFEYLVDAQVNVPAFDANALEQFNALELYAAIRFAKDIKLIDPMAVPEDDVICALLLCQRDPDGLLKGYGLDNSKSNRDRIRNLLKIDSAFIEQVNSEISGFEMQDYFVVRDENGQLKPLKNSGKKKSKKANAVSQTQRKAKAKKKKQGALKTKNPENQARLEIIINYAKAHNYLSSDDSAYIDCDLIEEVLISGNESLIDQFASGQIKEFGFRSAMNFLSEQLMQMMFNIYAIDTKTLEDEMFEVTKKLGKSLSEEPILVRFYLYIFTGSKDEEGNPCPILCGPDNKKPKKNRYDLADLKKLV